MKPIRATTPRVAVVSAICALLVAVFARAELRRPANWEQMPKSERPWVWVMDLEPYSPEAEPKVPFEGLRIALLPLHNSNNLDAHLEVPTEKFRKEKVLSRLTDEQRSRVLSLQIMPRPYKGKTSSAILTSRPFENLLFEAISRELEALGAEVVPSPIETAPITADSFARQVFDLPREESVDFYLAIKIEELYVKQFSRCCRTDPVGELAAQISSTILNTPTYGPPQELIPMVDLSYELSVRLADAKAGKVRWEGRSSLKQSSAGPARIHLMEWWEQVLRSSFPELIQKTIRNNEDLHEAIKPTTFKIRIPPGARKIRVADAPDGEPVEMAAAEPSDRAAAIEITQTRIPKTKPTEPPEGEPPPSD